MEQLKNRSEAAHFSSPVTLKQIWGKKQKNTPQNEKSVLGRIINGKFMVAAGSVTARAV